MNQIIMQTIRDLTARVAALEAAAQTPESVEAKPAQKKTHEKGHKAKSA